MSQVASPVASQTAMDPYEIGWYIESADEEIYGPVSRETIRRFLHEKTITANTLVRHCTQPEARPVADQSAIMQQFDMPAAAAAVGDRLAEAWPRKNRERQALAEASLPCAWHKRPATLVCVRCRAPYCNRCRQKPYRKQFFLCRRCQVGMHNRRFVALILDTLVLIYLPLFAAGLIVVPIGLSPNQAVLAFYAVQFATVVVFFGRDSLFGGAGAGKRLTGLRVVKTKDGATPLNFGQGIVRWLSQLIPFFNLVDAIYPYYDPLLRRFGDRWAGTRVIDAEPKLFKARAKIAQRLFKKGVQPFREVGMTMEELARLA
jgi:uncharacterized RDD family membrane protein YckC